MNAARSIVFGGFLQLATLAAVCAVACPPGHAATIRDLLGPAQTSASAGFDFPFNPLGGFANFRDYATITAPGMSGTGTAQFSYELHGMALTSDSSTASRSPCRLRSVRRSSRRVRSRCRIPTRR